MEQITPRIDTIAEDDSYGKFVMEPLEKGLGITLGNALRRVLLSSIPGAAITSVKIEGVLHEFSTIPGVKEDTTELLLNLKNLHVKIDRDGMAKLEPKTVWIDVEGAGEVTGADVRTPADVEVVNPELHIATVSDETARLSMEMTVEMGRGYVLPEQQEKVKPTIGVIPVGAVFTPVTKANFIVEPTRVGHKTDYERLVLEVQTNGSMKPGDAISEAARTLDKLIKLFVDFKGRGLLEFEEEMERSKDIELRAPDARIEELDFSVRTYNCLKKANILTIGELVQHSEQDLMNIRNFGKKSLTEVREKLAQLGLSLKRIGDIGLSEDFEDMGDEEEEEGGEGAVEAEIEEPVEAETEQEVI
ncbi:MAG TPA: DNA-directed RNA polymerase subunit alpha [Armatimonadota bacterium]|nr:DNA-directed RNA polymerase subunit alpha [Armatimonadota bacterium]